MIEDAYLAGEAMGLSVWCTDQAGPFQTVPHPGPSWRPEGKPARQPHEYLRDGTAKVLTLFHPADGRVRIKGVTACPNTVLHGWLKQELAAVLTVKPRPTAMPTGAPPRHSATRKVGLKPLRTMCMASSIESRSSDSLETKNFSEAGGTLGAFMGGSCLRVCSVS